MLNIQLKLRSHFQKRFAYIKTKVIYKAGTSTLRAVEFGLHRKKRGSACDEKQKKPSLL